MGSLSSPAALALRLGIDPSDEQAALMARFADGGDETLEVAGDDEQLAQRAVALAVLWRLMSHSNSSVRITAPTRRDAEHFLSFLEQVTQSVDPMMEHQTTWPRWNVMLVHGRAGWDLRYVSPVPAYIDELKPMKVHTVVALGARSSNPEWMAMDAKLDELHDKHLVKLVRVW